MTQPVVRIFPHSKEEFEDSDELRTWLITALKARGGRYRLHVDSSYGSNPSGSLILFRYENEIIGEAVVEQDYIAYDKPLKIGDFTYGGFIKFVPSSIRVYVGGLPVKVLGEFCGRDFSGARPYYKIEDWAVYPKILAEVAKEGFHS